MVEFIQDLSGMSKHELTRYKGKLYTYEPGRKFLGRISNEVDRVQTYLFKINK